ncbi:hypothetical protein DFP74_1701 [Nocardiopsis sp. Huas11]|uniref:hypothetical protein n=1 Tax=Nocardiopsis sp. Huas11 TaxID=2183912 RepID=UPI000F12094A|nr:hypothetical protein [Nocardiopsis sp. Huas11]RKS06078.1 hypothetical protein DFP74_1701 [Nocardiopsis sp. Huas11]
MPTPRSGGTPRTEAGRTYLGWRHAVLLPAPGPAPRRPAPADTESLSEDWLRTQRHSEARTNRPLYFALGGLALLALLCPLLWSTRVLPGSLALAGVLACAAVAAPIAFALVQSRLVIAQRLERAKERLAAEREERDRALREQQSEHARAHTAWQAAARAFEAQPRWYGVTVPPGVGSVVVTGGTDTGWSALLTTVGISRLREGGDLTVIDLTGHAVARELVHLARRCAVAPRRWVLPADLPRMTLGTNLDAGQRARVLSAVAAASGAGEDADADETLLLRLMEVLGPHAGVGELIGGLRALITPEGDTAQDDTALALLTTEQRTRVRERCADDPDIWERAWELERRLSPFESVGTRADDGEYAQVKIICTDRASGASAARAYGTYAVASLSELLEVGSPRQGPGAAPRSGRVRTVVVCGAEALPDDEVDQVLAAATGGGVEVVLMFRSATPAALARLDDPACLSVVMREPGATAEAVARAAASAGVGAFGDAVSDLHRLSEVVGEAVRGMVTEAGTDPDADPMADMESDDRFFPSPHTESGAVIRNAAAAVAPLDLVRHVRSATAWGRATAQAADLDTPVAAVDGADTAVRPFDLGAEELRELPDTVAVVLTEAGPVLTDTNPGILTLSTATLATVDDSRHTSDGSATRTRGGGSEAEQPVDGGRPRIVPPGAAAAADGGRSEQPAPVGTDVRERRVPPNLGPPPERLDWRV